MKTGTEKPEFNLLASVLIEAIGRAGVAVIRRREFDHAAGEAGLRGEDRRSAVASAMAEHYGIEGEG
jgi:hypothetical protein